MDADEVRTALAGFAVSDPEEAVQHAVAEGVVLVFQDDDEDAAMEPEGAQDAGEPSEDGNGNGNGNGDGDEDGTRSDAEPVRVLLGLDRYALAEESLADGLARLVNSCEKGADWTDAAAAAPTPSAGELIRAAATAAWSPTAGASGPGTSLRPSSLPPAVSGCGRWAPPTARTGSAGWRPPPVIPGPPSRSPPCSRARAGRAGTRKARSPWTYWWCWTLRRSMWRRRRCWWSRSATGRG